MKSVKPCFGLLLAAGFSRRFGADKRLEVGLTCVAQWLKACSDSAADLDRLYIATRPDDAFAEQVNAWLAPSDDSDTRRHRCTLLEVQDAALGMGHSLASAVQQIPEGSLIVGLADMPWVKHETLQQLAQALDQQLPEAIVQPVWQDQPGNPVGFGAGQRPQLSRSTGDEGARALVKKARSEGRLIELAVTDPGIVKDVDVPADLPALPDTER